MAVVGIGDVLFVLALVVCLVGPVALALAFDDDTPAECQCARDGGGR
jgi:hypothetical protein